MALKVDTGRKDSRSFIQGKQKYSKLTVDVGTKSHRSPQINLNNPKSDITQNNTSNTANSISQKPIQNKRKKQINIQTTGSIELKRGQKVNLNQKVPNLSKLLIGLEWEIKNSLSQSMELDTSIFMVDRNNKTADENFIYYNNLNSKDGGVKLKEDHGTGFKEGYDEIVQLDLNKIPTNIEKLAFTVTINEAHEKRQNFSLVSNGYFRIIDGQTKSEVFCYKFNEQLSVETAIVVVEIYRYKNEWKLNSIGSGFKGGLEALCDNYGIEII